MSALWRPADRGLGGARREAGPESGCIGWVEPWKAKQAAGRGLGRGAGRMGCGLERAGGGAIEGRAGESPGRGREGVVSETY